VVALGSLRLQDEIGLEVGEELARRGHRVEQSGGPIAHPVMLWIDPADGTIHAAGDPKAKRHAAAIDLQGQPAIRD